MDIVIGSRVMGWPVEGALTFLQYTWQLTDDLKTRSLRMEAKGVTPMPPPTSTDTSNLSADPTSHFAIFLKSLAVKK